VQHNLKFSHHLWRGFVGHLVAYTLIINGLLSGVVGAEWASQVAAGLLGEHCLTDARAPTNPAPAGQPDDSSHCAYCTLTTTAGVLPAQPPSVRITPPRASVTSVASDHDLMLWPGHPGKLPRGPPQRA